MYSHVALPHRCSGVMLFLLMTSEELCQHAKLCLRHFLLLTVILPLCVLHGTIMSKEVVNHEPLVQ